MKSLLFSKLEHRLVYFMYLEHQRSSWLYSEISRLAYILYLSFCPQLLWNFWLDWTRILMSEFYFLCACTPLNTYGIELVNCIVRIGFVRKEWRNNFLPKTKQNHNFSLDYQSAFLFFIFSPSSSSYSIFSILSLILCTFFLLYFYLFFTLKMYDTWCHDTQDSDIIEKTPLAFLWLKWLLT